MKRLFLLTALLSACQAIGPTESDQPDEPEKPEPPENADPVPPVVLPDGFDVLGAPTIEPAVLGPREAWRELRSRLTTLQADSRRWERDVLVSFAPDAVHVTRRNGARTTWQLPAGLSLEVRTVHVIVRNDLTLDGFLEDGTQVPAREEVTVAVVRLGSGTKQKTESRLIIKGGKAFRSMTPR